MRKLMLSALGFSTAILFVATEYNRIFLALIFLAVGAVMTWRFAPKPEVGKWLVLGAMVGFSYFSLYHSLFYSPLTQYHEKTMEVHGVVLDFPLWSSYRYTVMVELEFPETKAKTLLYLGEEAEDLKPGDKITTTATLKSAEETFDGEEITYYTAKGISLRGVGTGELVHESASSVGLRHLPSYLANWLKEGILSIFPQPYGGLVQALVTGNRENLTDDFSASLQRTGLSHTVAVSGMHLAFLAGLMRLMLPSGRKWTAALVIFVMVLFMLVSGSTPSIMRATVMIVLLHLAPLFGRERDDMTALATALLVILLENPYAVNHVGLHLSVLSVAGILCFADKIQDKISSYFHYDWEFADFSIQKFVLSSISATLSAMIFTTPLVAYYFGTISLIAPLSNLLTLWAISISFAVGLIVGMIGIVFPLLASFVSLPLVPILEYLLWIVPILSRNALAAITMDSLYYRCFLLFVYVLILGFLLYAGKKNLFFLMGVGSLAFLLAFTFHRLSHFQTEFSIQVFDVGQGQSILFTLGDTLILSDCGGNSYENVGDIVADTVQALGRNHIELVVLSHCHSDHANGVSQLLDRLEVEVIAMPPVDFDNELQLAIVEKAMMYGTAIWVIEEETLVSMGDVGELRLYPPLSYGDANDASVTLLVTVGEQDVLVTGDMGQEMEELLLATYELPDIEIFVVGHHGSKFSTSEVFLEGIQAEIAIISVSAKNNYGHPTAEVLWKLIQRDIVVYRTDYQGKLWLQSIG